MIFDIGIVYILYFNFYIFFCKFFLRELRLIEVFIDLYVCDKILEYNVYKERLGSNRFVKGRSETMEILYGLV